MKKNTILIFSTFLLALSLYSIIHPSYDLQLFINVENKFLIGRIIVSLILLSYTLFPFIRRRFTQLFIFLGGLLLITGAITAILSPTMYGYLSSYAVPGDIFTAMEAGILALLAGFQLEITNTPLPNFFATIIKLHTPQWNSSRPKQLLSTHPQIVS
ncbi:MAG: hypothetical protein NVS3B23_07100 [Candidatus Saccharimonadales bacterium]